MFEAQDGTLFVQAWLEVNPSATTPRDELNELTFLHQPKVEGHFLDCSILDSANFFHGNNWRDHLKVLIDLTQDDIPVLKRLVFEGVEVILKINWIGELGATPPQISQKYLGPLSLAGITLAGTSPGKRRVIGKRV